MSKLFYILIFLMIVPIVSAADIKFYDITSEINPDGTVYNKISFLIGDNVTDFNFVIFAQARNFRYEANFDGLVCSSTGSILGTDVTCNNIPQTEKKVLTFYYDTNSYTRLENRKGVFNANYKLFTDAESASIAVKLPEGFVLSNGTNVPSFSPSDGVITSDGRRIVMQWFKKDIPANQDLTFSVIYEDRRPEPVNDLSRVVVSSFVLLIIFALVMYFILKGKQKEQTETILEVLTHDEKAVINIVRNNGGSVIQKKIVETTDYSKAKVSRILRDLQERGIIRLEPSGRENMVYLTKKIKK